MPLITSDQATESALKKDGIIPDLLDSFQPKTMLVISYGDGLEVALGNTLPVKDTQNPPQISFQVENPDDKYTLILTDPDAPSRANPKNREFRHWTVTNISGASDFQPADVSQGNVLTEYMGPAPPAGSGPHRYIFLLFKQTSSSDASALTTPLTDRPKFNTKEFTSQAGLELVGANYYFAENP
ncbi:hypothetical protein BX616_004281 [Lobosporangium transversale]|uniref:Phosphatidylethanolamine-binding protein n=1 Tax=Lobosporangium transversale TaxID=64571 RepID=A0A1Y2G5F1_9FUNG|nr:phosphatidylethanolamine-binding protein [Lobosporangium transversale]KAF9916232.1 hypothetical protein BX616_004281 [Lobosporangium transversale]ORY95124.1 phosphatidylethanolamine-binding protein [Lobosporangium transversale]|eukprot:XP_021875331.1 phosphatidylethanolamine-binding protein [Lobosporangium transversale]